MVKGLSLDLTTCDPDDGKPWDFTKRDKRDKALDMVIQKKALLLVGSPMCKAFSRLQNITRSKRDPGEYERMVAEAELLGPVQQCILSKSMEFLRCIYGTATSPIQVVIMYVCQHCGFTPLYDLDWLYYLNAGKGKSWWCAAGKQGRSCGCVLR